jgi:hypothetical protein
MDLDFHLVSHTHTLSAHPSAFIFFLEQPLPFCLRIAHGLRLYDLFVHRYGCGYLFGIHAQEQEPTRHQLTLAIDETTERSRRTATHLQGTGRDYRRRRTASKRRASSALAGWALDARRTASRCRLVQLSEWRSNFAGAYIDHRERPLLVFFGTRIATRGVTC